METNIYNSNNINIGKPYDNENNNDCDNNFNSYNFNSNNSFQSLNGEEINENNFKHNNMKPYYNGNLQIINLNKGRNLENLTGVSSINIKKESIPLFKPEKDFKYINGAPNNTDFYRSRMNISEKKNNVKPWDEIQVGLDLNKYDTTNGSLGFNSSMEARECWAPKNVDELRVLTNQKNHIV